MPEDDFTVTGDELDRCLDRAEKADAERDRYRSVLARIAHSDTLAYPPPATALRSWASAALDPARQKEPQR